MKKIFILIIFLLGITNIKAYENDYFKIDIPETYKINEDDKKEYKWENENNFIAITVTDNTKLKYNIEKYTETDINNQKKYIENNINKQLEEYDIKVSVTDIKKAKINDDTVLNYHIYWPSKDLTGYETYQIGNIYTTKNYLITILYSSDKKIEDDSEYYNIIKSVSIKDDKIKEVNYYYIIIIIPIILAIITVYKRHRKQKA